MLSTHHLQEKIVRPPLLLLLLVALATGCGTGADNDTDPDTILSTIDEDIMMPGGLEPARDVQPLNPVIALQEITEILPFNDYGEQGVLWGDFDNNGKPDLIYMRHGENPGLYKQVDGKFVDVFDQSGIKFDDWIYNQQGDRHGASCADFDNDGNQDLFIGHGALIGETLGIKFDELLRGDGSFRFEDVSYASGVLNRDGRTRGAQWVDINNDGWLDLYISNFETANVMYTSNRDGTFTDTTKQLNLDSIGWRSSWADFNNDGFMDVVQTSPLQLHMSNAGESFKDVTLTYLEGPTTFAYSLAWADLDNDGDQDLLVGRASLEGMLFRNDGDTFTKLDFSEIGLTPMTTVAGIAPADMDNDGDLDIVIKTSEGVRTFKNSGILEYELAHFIERADPIEDMWNGDISVEDFDGDGLLDVASDDRDGLRLYRNTTDQAGNWLRILLNGVTNNRMGYGSKIEVTSTDGLTSTTTEYTGASAGMRSNGCQPLQLGVGSAERVSVEVTWPNGQVSLLDNVATNTLITVSEQ